MNKYLFDRLEWQQFELLSFKCLQFDIGPSIAYLERGHDKGRDFVFNNSTSFFGQTIGRCSYVFQVKHKSTSNNFAALKSDLVQELNKVYVKNNLQYSDYCLVTNIAQSATQYDELNEVVNNFKNAKQLKTPERFHLYSYRQLELCVDKNPSLKLDFPSILSTTDLKAILKEIANKNENNNVMAWNRVYERNAPRFIYTEAFEKAIIILRESNAILLSGPPKSGKTFSAEMLAFRLVAEEGFIPQNISRIDVLFDRFDANKKQVFIFDDSIGKHSMELYRADALNRSLSAALELIDSKHKIVFASREYIVKDFSGYADTDAFEKRVAKIGMAASDWTAPEKESLIRRYYKSKFDEEIDEYLVTSIISHKNFEPETVRAYFDNCSNFDLFEFRKHLNKPDQYLHQLFSHLDTEKQIVTLSILFSLSGSEKDIGFVLINVLDDLKIQRVINLKWQLSVLEDSLVTQTDEKYSFLHPSMSDYFIDMVAKDPAQYRRLMFRNINPTLLSLISMEAKRDVHILLLESDIQELIIGLKRMIYNPALTFIDVNSIFAWLNDPAVQLKMKFTSKKPFEEFKTTFERSLKDMNYNSVLDGANAYQVIDYLKNIYYLTEKDTIPFNALKRIISKFEDDQNYWQIAFRISSLTDKSTIDRLVRKDLFSEFENQLTADINWLGTQLYGAAYPDFHELKLVRREAGQKPRQHSDFRQKTDSNWYPKYLLCKQKLGVIKGCQPIGFSVYNKLADRFELLRRLEHYESSRYNYKRKNPKWDTENDREPTFYEPEEYADMMEREYYNWDEDDKRDEEE